MIVVVGQIAREMPAIHELSASSRHRHLVLYDPAAIPKDIPVDPDLEAQDPNPAPKKAIRELAAHGHALVVRIPTEDCEATICLQIDQGIDDYFRKRGTVLVTDARLHVPSGEIKADGVEFIVRSGEVRTHSEAQSCRVPKGAYDVEVLELINWKLKNVEEEVRARTTRLERFSDRLIQAYTWCGILLFPSNLLIAPVAIGIAWASKGWGSALIVGGIVLAIDIVILGGFRILDRATRRFSFLSRVSQLHRTLEQDHPDIVVLLRTAPAGRVTQVPTFAAVKLIER